MTNDFVSKCAKKRGKLELCDNAQTAVSGGFVIKQSIRNFKTHRVRQRLAIVKDKINCPLLYCPWCRANIDTAPKEAS